MIIFTKETLREALNGLRVLKLTKQTMPCLQRVLVAGHEAVVQFDGTDLDQYLRYEGPGSSTSASRVLVPYEVLVNVAKQADAAGDIRLSADGEPCIIYPVSGSLISVPFPPLAVAEFPPKPCPNGEPITLPAGVLGAMNEALGCASTDSSRYLLNSVYLDAHAVAATDGRQLYRRNSLDLPLAEGAIFPRSPVPGILPDNGGELMIWTANDRRLAQITAGRWRWITKLIDGTYPNHVQVIPKQADYGVTLRLAEEDVTRIKTVLPKLPGFKDRDSLIVFALSADKEPVLRTAPKYPKVHVALERSAVVCSVPVEIAFNARYLLGGLENGLRELHLRDAVSPVLMTGESRVQLWMPTRLEPPKPLPEPAPVSASAATTANASPSDPSSESPSQVVPAAASDDAESGTQPNVSVTHSETHNPSTTMVAPATNAQPASEIRHVASTGAVAPRVTPAAAPAQPASIVDAINTRLVRLRDLLREAGNEFANIQALVKEQQRSYRTLERDHESLKKNIRVLREVSV